MPTPTTLQVIDTYWAAHFGCRIEDLHAPGTLVVPHAGLGDYRGVFFFRRGAACIVSVPPDRLTGTAALSALTAEECFSETLLRARFGTAVERVVGPAWLGYADRGDCRPISATGVRPLGSASEAALRRLAAACPATEWEHSGIRLDGGPLFGAFVGEEIVAAAGCEIWGDRIAHLGVVTHPAHRGRGHGRAVAGALTAFCLERDLIPQYRTLLSNTPSMAVARALGFQPYATTLAVRLQPAV